jgi:hypothetical protein
MAQAKSKHITLPSDGRSQPLNPNQGTGEPPAHPAQAVSRRGMLMNTAVTFASLASATAIAGPAAVAPAEACDPPAVPETAEIEALRAKFEPLWESLLPLHESFAEWEGKPSKHPSWGEWNRLFELALPIAKKVLELSAFTPRSFGLKAAAVLVTETIGYELGEELDWDVAQFMFEVASAGGMAVPSAVQS